MVDLTPSTGSDPGEENEPLFWPDVSREQFIAFLWQTFTT
jgi:hypothetical protein